MTIKAKITKFIISAMVMVSINTAVNADFLVEISNKMKPNVALIVSDKSESLSEWEKGKIWKHISLAKDGFVKVLQNKRTYTTLWPPGHFNGQ